MNLADLVGQVKNNKLSATELVTLSIKRIEEYNPRINAVIAERFEEALCDAKVVDKKLPFAGIPILIKDLFCDVAGLPTTNGCSALRKTLALKDGPTVSQLKKLGFIIVGKTNTAEFGLSTTTEPLAFGPTKSPWNEILTAGGSSGGAAAAVASCMVPLAHASDAGGSIRIPAAYCGLVGLKPSSPVVKQTIKQQITSQHVLTRCVSDSELVLRYTRPELFQHSLKNKAYKIALMDTHPVHPVSPACRKQVTQAASMLQDMGHHVEPCSFNLDWYACVDTFIVIIASNLYQQLPNARGCELPSKLMWELGRIAKKQSPQDIQEQLNLILHSTVTLFKDFDFILSPATAQAAPLLQTQKISLAENLAIRLATLTHSRTIIRLITQQLSKQMFADAPFTMPYNLLGCPAISLPTCWSKHLPSGIQLAAKQGDDNALLILSHTLMCALPVVDSIPGLL